MNEPGIKANTPLTDEQCQRLAAAPRSPEAAVLLQLIRAHLEATSQRLLSADAPDVYRMQGAAKALASILGTVESLANGRGANT